jgi:DNA adenine methylase
MPTTLSIEVAGRLLAGGRDDRRKVEQLARRIQQAVGAEAICSQMSTADPERALERLQRRLQERPNETLSDLRPLLQAAERQRGRGGRKRGRKAISFIKWAGSKGPVMDQLLALFPACRGTYFEPMAGSGTVFFKLPRPRRAVLGDINAELMTCYQVIRDELPDLQAALDRHHNTEQHFKRVRAQDPRQLEPVERAARMVFLNKTCFNGLYRVNSRGKFNVPYGNILWANIRDDEALERVHRRLQGVSLRCGDYHQTLVDAGPGDLVYLDPPYLSPGPKASIFYAYQPRAFGERQHRRLAETFRDLDRRGCKVLLSNSNVPLVRELYQGFSQQVLHTRRPLNSVASRRAGWEELVIHNLGPETRGSR